MLSQWRDRLTAELINHLHFQQHWPCAWRTARNMGQSGKVLSAVGTPAVYGRERSIPFCVSLDCVTRRAVDSSNVSGKVCMVVLEKSNSLSYLVVILFVSPDLGGYSCQNMSIVQKAERGGSSWQPQITRSVEPTKPKKIEQGYGSRSCPLVS